MPQVWTSNEQGAPVELCECRNEACEYDFVVGALKAHQEAHGSLSDVAVLYRTHAVGNLVYKALRDHRIPCQTSAADVFARGDVAPLAPWAAACAAGEPAERLATDGPAAAEVGS